MTESDYAVTCKFIENADTSVCITAVLFFISHELIRYESNNKMDAKLNNYKAYTYIYVVHSPCI